MLTLLSRSLPLSAVLVMAPITSFAQPFSHSVHSATIDDPSLTAPVGMVWIQSTGFGKKETIAQLDAEKAAMETLIFQGVAGTQFAMPLVADESGSRKEHADVYTGFFEQQGFRAFVSKTQTVSGLTKFKGGKKMETRMLVDVNGLRKYLEDKGVIKKFGM
jgi:hypothetical protein